ncbi:MAG TPA: hypothetical protein VG944_18455 [Fimbriimonas sp.]|nr:hypothetical protein [Fimbriimonas sp.]
MNIAEGIGRVGDACRSLLWAFGYQGDSDNASELEKWIAEVKRIGEHQYAVQPVEDRVDDGTHEGIEAIEHRPTALLRLLQVKYPQDLPAVWAHVIAEHPEFDDYPVLQAIWYSSLPRERKVEAFELGLTSKNYGCIELSLYLLSQFDQSRYEREAPRMIRRLPDAVPDAFDVHDAVQVAANGLSARNPEAFAALVDLTTRAAKQFKIELLECASRADNTAQGRKCLAFLRHFMDDPTLLSAPKLLPEERSLPSATKDYAAEYAAQLLQIELPNNKSQGYWDMVRAMVLKRMEKPYVYRPCP